MSRLTADTTQIKSAFGSSASVALRNLFLFVGAIGLMVYTSPKLSALVLVAIPIIVLPLFAVRARGARTLARGAGHAGRRQRLRRRKPRRRAHHAGLRRRSSRRARGSPQPPRAPIGAARAATKARAILTAFAIFLAFASVVGVLWLGAQDVLAGRMTGGQLSQFVLYAVLGASALGQLSEVWSEISAAAGAAGRLAEILRIQPQIAAPGSAAPAARSRHAARSSSTRVGFAYPTRPDEAVFDGLSLRDRAGRDGRHRRAFRRRQVDAVPAADALLRSAAGAASSSTASTSRDADPADLRRRIALVPQDPVIFARHGRRQYRAMARPAPRDARSCARGRARRGARVHRGPAGGLSTRSSASAA